MTVQKTKSICCCHEWGYMVIHTGKGARITRSFFFGFSLISRQELEDRKHQALLTSPEMCLDHPPFRKWLTSTASNKDILAVIIDEAHCISQWGGDFRTSYSKLNKLRAFLPVGIPFLATSAMLPPAAIADICSNLQIKFSEAFFLNLGNRRSNITASVTVINSTKDFAGLHAALPDPQSVNSPDDLPKTIVFTNSVNLSPIICRDPRNHYGAQFASSIDYLHAHHTTQGKQRVMKRFNEGKIKILIATEAAGMVSCFRSTACFLDSRKFRVQIFLILNS